MKARAILIMEYDIDDDDGHYGDQDHMADMVARYHSDIDKFKELLERHPGELTINVFNDAGEIMSAKTVQV